VNHAPPVAEFSYALAFMTGLFGAGHCLGMCGGLVSAFFMKLKARGPWPYLVYHLARIAIYALVGLLAALLGAVFVSTGRIGLAQGVLQIVAGALVVLLGFDLLGLSPIRNAYGFAPLAWLRKHFVGATQKGPLIGALIGGAISSCSCSASTCWGSPRSAMPTASRRSPGCASISSARRKRDR